MNEKIGEKYDLPEDFAAIVDRYIQGRVVIKDKAELIAFWQNAIDTREKYPEMQESIAQWTMSCGASSPLINDDGLFDEIHYTFGSLEYWPEDSDKAWNELQKLVTEAKKV